MSTGNGVRSEVHEAKPVCEVVGIALCLRGRPLEDSTIGEPASDLSLVRSLWLCAEEKRGSVRKQERVRRLACE